MSDRPFRRPESFAAEQISRRAVLDFLRERGFEIQDDRRERQGQTIIARAPTTDSVAMRVKLGWRRASEGRDGIHLSAYSAVQLLARVDDADWVGTIERKMAREQARGVTHLLFAQRDGPDFTHAALIPPSAVPEIWTLQHEAYDRLISENRLGRRTSNPAKNGRSPTLWLQDERGGSDAAAVLWNHPATIDLNLLRVVSVATLIPEEIPDSHSYREGARRRITVNVYERDRRARVRCIEHHGVICCICGFDFGAKYGSEAAGYIHIHHLKLLSATGESVVDPVEDLRPVCPNCHAIIHLNGGIRSIQEVEAMISSRFPR